MSRKGRKGDWIPHDWDDHYPRRIENRRRIRERVLEASRQLLQEVGPRAFTVKEVAWRAMVGRTTIYKYFGLKAELLAACREDAAARRSRRFQWSVLAARARADRQSGLPRSVEMVRQAVLGLVENLREETDLFLLAAAEGVRAKRRPRELRNRHTVRGTDLPLPMKYLSTVTRLLQEAAQKGDLAGHVDAHTAALWLGAVWWHGLCTRGPSMDGWQDTAGRDLEEMLRALVAG